MDLKVQANAVRLALQFVDTGSEIHNIVPYRPQKTLMPQEAKVVSLLRSTPEQEGIESEYLYPFVYNLVHDPDINLHTLLVVRNGRVIAESNVGGYSTKTWTITHSLCKSVTGLAILMLIDEGKLKPEDKIIGLVDEGNLLTDFTHRHLTLRHLLTMSSGINFNEIGAVTSDSWVKSYLESGYKFEPGSEFSYNSMNTYLLSHIVKKVSGQSLTEFLRPRLFEPLKINMVHWETCPQGTETGGWGMYLTPEDMAKIGMLYMQKGQWEGKTIVSPYLIESAVTRQISVPHSYGAFDYGYQCWVSRFGSSFLLNGMFGQNVMVFPQANLLVAATAGTSEVFQQGEFFRRVRRYFEGYMPQVGALPENNEGQAKLNSLLHISQGVDIREETDYGSNLEKVNLLEKVFSGQVFTFEEDEQKRGSIIPLIQQILRNGYTSKLQFLTFMMKEKGPTLIFSDAYEHYEITLGFSQSFINTIVSKEEPYMVEALGQLGIDEEENIILKIRLNFLETASSMFLKVSFKDKEIVIEFEERPGRDMIYQGLAALSEEIAKNKLTESLLAKIEEDVLANKIDELFAPKIIGRLKE